MWAAKDHHSWKVGVAGHATGKLRVSTETVRREGHRHVTRPASWMLQHPRHCMADDARLCLTGGAPRCTGVWCVTRCAAPAVRVASERLHMRQNNARARSGCHRTALRKLCRVQHCSSWHAMPTISSNCCEPEARVACACAQIIYPGTQLWAAQEGRALYQQRHCCSSSSLTNGLAHAGTHMCPCVCSCASVQRPMLARPTRS